MTKYDKSFDVACSVIGMYQQFLTHLRYGPNHQEPVNDKDHFGFIFYHDCPSFCFRSSSVCLSIAATAKLFLSLS